MTSKQLERVVAQLPARQGEVYAAVREHGPIKPADLRPFVDAANTGLTGRLRELADKGLIRHPAMPSNSPVSERNVASANPDRTMLVDGVLYYKYVSKRHWEVTPAADVEAAREQAAQRKPRLRDVSEWSLDERVQAHLYLKDDPEVEQALKDPVHAKRRRQIDNMRRDSRSRAAKLKRMQGTGFGGHGHVSSWFERKRTVYWAVQSILDIDESAFWKSSLVTEDDIEEILSDLLLAKQAVDHTVESLQRGDMSAALRAKVEKLIAQAASTPYEEEAATFAAKAKELAAGREVIPAPIDLRRPEDDPFGLGAMFDEARDDVRAGFKKEG